MSRRILWIAALCIALAALWSVPAQAYPPSLSGWSFKVGSVDASTIWTGVGNFDLKPTDIVVTLKNVDLRLYAVNPGSNTGGVGVPFRLTTPVSGTDSISPILKNGKYASTIVFPDSVFTAAIDPSLLQQALPNPNWTVDPNRVDVLRFRGIVQGFTDVGDRCEGYYAGATTVDSSCFPFDPAWENRYEEEVVHLEVDCTLQDGAYACTVLQDWEYSKNSPVFVPR